MRVKCIHRCFFASSWRLLCAPLAGGVAVSRVVAMRLSPFRDGYPIWTKLTTLRRNCNRSLGESGRPGAVQLVQSRGRVFGDSAYCTRVSDPGRLAEPAKRLVGRGTFGRTDRYGRTRHPPRWGDEALRRDDGGGPADAVDRARRLLRAARSVGLRQDHHAAHDRRLRG